jgi:lysophospholipase L1-like esterase
VSAIYLPPVAVPLFDVYIPPEWGSIGWTAASRQAGIRPVVVADWVDSIYTFFASRWAANQVAAATALEGLIMSYLQGRYGDGGSGFFSTFNVDGVTAGSASGVAASGAGGNGAGGWDKVAQGMNSNALFPHVAASGVTLTDPNVRGSAIDMLWIPGTAAGITFQYNIDGAGLVQVANTVGAVTGIGKTTVGVAAGTHQLVIVANGGQPFIMGWTGRNPTGILPVRLGHAGRTSNDLTTAGFGYPAAQTTGLTSIPGAVISGTQVQTQQAANLWPQPIDLLLIQLGINDVAISATAPQTFAANISQAIDIAKGANSACEVIITMAHRGNTADANDLYSDYCGRARGIAETYAAAFFSYWAGSFGRNNYGYMAGQQFWGDGTADGLPGADAVHPSNIGHAAMFAKLRASLPLL